MKFLIGKKLGMTTLFDEKKGALNVTLIACGKNTVTSLRTKEKDGYAAVQIETEKTSRRSVKKEFRVDRRGVSSDEVVKTLGQYVPGQELSVTQYTLGEKVNISGTTKAKGFQGVVKRHGFKGSPASHGRKHDHRKPGSIGSSFPEHVFKGKRMAGRMGGTRFTVRNLEVVLVNEEERYLAVRGAVPGVNGRLLEIVATK